jgi:hypothetical protein
LSRYRDETGVAAEHLTVELARLRLGEDWKPAFLEQAQRGGIERVLL